MDEDWDYLIVLDACRYDYFSYVYSFYFNGNLKKVFSPGSWTPEWCVKSFTEYYEDVIYISANPYINSKYSVSSFDAKKHFYKVVDVWFFGWDDKVGTVFPEEVNKSLLYFKEKHPDKRFIIHYLQPHAPYISPKFISPGFPKPSPSKRIFLKGVKNAQTSSGPFKQVERMINLFDFFSRKVGFGNLFSWKLREYVGLPPASPMDLTRRIYGIEGLRMAYYENLKIVLKYVAILVSDLRGTIIITSDHGEFLGEERGKFGHYSGSKSPILRVVPWFEVHSVKEDVKKLTVKSELRRKIKRLSRKLRAKKESVKRF